MNEAITPRQYRVLLEPDIPRERYEGTVCAAYNGLDGDAETLVLHARDLDITTCSGAAEGGPEHELPFRLVPDRELLEIDTSVVADSFGGTDCTVILQFRGKLLEDNRGLYLASYTEYGVSKKVVLSQFEKRDARKAFPCFDEPAAKATFDIELIVPSSYVAISNNDILEETSLPEGKKRVCFQTTPVMSTYLLFIAAGEFSALERRTGGLPVRVWAVGGNEIKGDAAIGFAGDALRYFIEYTGAPYPFSKLDLIACPDFAFGAMENYGAISYRENLLLFDSEKDTSDNLERIGQVTTHEVAHMWFGDLVSPLDWSYIWLNESLATYFGYLVNEKFHPEWRGLEQLTLDNFAPTLHRDSLAETVPIETEKGTFLEMSPAIVPIIYSKAAAVLRMFHSFIGEEAFRTIIRRFLEKYAFASADSDQFLDCFYPMIERSVPGAWILQKGFPLIDVEKRENSLVLRQRRFLFSGEDADAVWPVPLAFTIYHDGTKREERRVLFNRKTMVIEADSSLGPIRAVNLNRNQYGYYRVRYDNALLEAAGRLVSSGELSDYERFGLVDDLVSLLYAEEISLEELIDFLTSRYRGEKAFLPLSGIARSLSTLYFLAAGEKKETLFQTAVELLYPRLEGIGMMPDGSEDHGVKLLRRELMTALFHIGEERVVSFLGKCMEDIYNGKRIEPELEKLALKEGASGGIPREFFFSRIRDERLHEAARIRFLSALLFFQKSEDLSAVFRFLLEEVPYRNWYKTVEQAQFALHAGEMLFSWYVDNFSAIRAIHPYHAAKIDNEVIVWGGIRKRDEATLFAEKMLKEDKIASPETAKMALNFLDIFYRLSRKLR